MQRTFFLCFCVAISSCSFFSTVGDSPSGGGDYIPPGWSAPDLTYEKSAYFPARVVDFRQAPGQYADSDTYRIAENTEKLLGAPNGGGVYGADNSSVVSLGMAGGRVIFEFDPPIEDHEDNIGGYDFIVYGNSFWTAGGASSPSWEPGVIRVMQDDNDDGLMNDTWYLIPGSHLESYDAACSLEYSVVFDSDGNGIVSWTGGVSGSHDFTESQPWWREGEALPSEYADVWLLPDTLFDGSAPDEEYKDVWGYADIAPTMILGDLDGDGDTGGIYDYPGIDPAYFYTVPDTHGNNAIDAGSGGGSAIDIAWAVDPGDFALAELDSVTWIEISSSSLVINATLGENSCEVDAVVRVRRE